MRQRMATKAKPQVRARKAKAPKMAKGSLASHQSQGSAAFAVAPALVKFRAVKVSKNKRKAATATVQKRFPLSQRAVEQYNKLWGHGLELPAAQTLMIKARRTGLVDYNGNWCPECEVQLTASDVRAGFGADPNEISTRCPACEARFAPIMRIGDRTYDDESLRFSWLCRPQTFEAWDAFLLKYEAEINGDPERLLDILLRKDPGLAWNIMEYAPDGTETLPDGIKSLFCGGRPPIHPVMQRFGAMHAVLNKCWAINTTADWLSIPVTIVPDLAAILGIDVFDDTTLAQIIACVDAKPKCGPVPPPHRILQAATAAAAADDDSLSNTVSPPPPAVAAKKPRTVPDDEDSE